MTKRTYKKIFSKVSWNVCHTKKYPFSDICIDVDSLIFRYLIDYINNINEKIPNYYGINLFDTSIMKNILINNLSEYSLDKLENLLCCIIRNKISYILVFGNGYINEKRELIYEYVAKKKVTKYNLSHHTYRIDNSFCDLLKKYILSLRDEVRDKVKNTIKYEYIEDIEPDIYCSQNYDVIMSEDYDLFLFGAKTLIKKIDDEEIVYLHYDELLNKLNLDSKQLIIACVLCGTDYNNGIKNIGPVRSTKIAKNDINNSLIDYEKVNFFIENSRNHES
jgi:hypothetical protein